ncbi:MAG: HxsD-like protein [Polyangiaceae bacterium]
MIELRLHEELYDGFAVDEAAKTYRPYASIDLSRADKYYVVKVTAAPDAAEDDPPAALIAAELANFALGKTIERALSAAPQGGSE